MSAVYELTTVTPHEPPRRRYGRAEWPLYAEGYYTALSAALAVMDGVVAQWAAVEKDRRRIARAQRAAARARLQVEALTDGEVVGVFVDRDVEMVPQRPHGVQWETKTEHVLRHVIDAREVYTVAPHEALRAPAHTREQQGIGHRGTDTVAFSGSPLQIETQTTPDRPVLAIAATVASLRRGRAHSSSVHETPAADQRKISKTKRR